MSHRVHDLVTGEGLPKSITLRSYSDFEKILVKHNQDFRSSDPTYPTERYYYSTDSCNIFYSICDTRSTCNADGITLEVAFPVSDEWTCIIVYNSYSDELGSCYRMKFYHKLKLIIGYIYICVENDEEFIKYKDLWGYASKSGISFSDLKPYFIPFIGLQNDELFSKLFKQLYEGLLLIEPSLNQSEDMNANLIDFMESILSRHR